MLDNIYRICSSIRPSTGIGFFILIFGLFITFPNTVFGATNLIQNPSLEAVSGGLPTSWEQGEWGELTAVFTYPVSGHGGGNAGKVEVSNYLSGDAKWYFAEVPVTSGTSYTFSNWSLSDRDTSVIAQYQNQSGAYSYVFLGSVLGTNSWAQFTKTFTVPTGVVSMTVFHVLAQNGSLTVDDYSLEALTVTPPPQTATFKEGMVTFSFDDGFRSTYEVGLPILDKAGIKSTQAIITKSFSDPEYVTKAETKSMWQRGHEIASHTRTHPDLTTLSRKRLSAEVLGSRIDLLALGITPVTTLVYPYGEYNTTVINTAKSAGYTGARAVQDGYNTPATSKWALQDQHVTSDVTFETIQGWIDHARTEKEWVVLELHRQDVNGGLYSNDPALLQKIVDYVVAQNIKTVTLGEGIKMLAQ